LKRLSGGKGLTASTDPRGEDEYTKRLEANDRSEFIDNCPKTKKRTEGRSQEKKEEQKAVEIVHLDYQGEKTGMSSS